MKFDEERELSIEDIKAYIKDFLNGNVSFDKLCKADIYTISAAMEECLREQIAINRELLSNQKSMYETNKTLISRIDKAIKELSNYNIDFLSIKNGQKNYNDEIVYHTFYILKGNPNGKEDC